MQRCNLNQLVVSHIRNTLLQIHDPRRSEDDLLVRACGSEVREFLFQARVDRDVLGLGAFADDLAGVDCKKFGSIVVR